METINDLGKPVAITPGFLPAVSFNEMGLKPKSPGIS